jgi:ABC-type transport system involved in multi-copper enzyme maturation permease subunit
MTFLPILDRELRVRARSRVTYWSRFAVALVGALVWLPQMLWSGPFTTPAPMGAVLLNVLITTAFLLCCSACLLTADIISSERREGTLGLLLLTRVKVLDVLAGKLGSAGLTSLCALMAFLPMLMLPVLAGGVTGGEAFRKGLVLPHTLFLALAAGLWASAGGREWSRTARNAALLLAGIVLVPSLLDFLWARFFPAGPTLSLLSPLGALVNASDAGYKSSPEPYWVSLILVQAAGWALVIAAGYRLKGGWDEERGESQAATPGPIEAVEEAAAWPSRQPLGDDANPIAWLVQRQRGYSAILWAGALVSFAYHGFFAFGFRFVRSAAYLSLTWPLSLGSGVLVAALFAWGTSRFFVEARRTGELELLLTTPLGAKEVVSAQSSVLKWRLRWPIRVMLAPQLLQGAYVIAMVLSGSNWGHPFGLPYVASWLLGCVNVLFDVGALCWVGMWFGLKAGGQARAVVWTVCLVTGVPFLIYLLFPVLVGVFVYSFAARSGMSLWFTTLLPQVVVLLVYVWLIGLAKRHLRGDLAAGEPMRLDLRQSISVAVRDAGTALRRARHWTPS